MFARNSSNLQLNMLRMQRAASPKVKRNVSTKSLTMATLNRKVKEAEYAVRGRLVLEAEEIQKVLSSSDHKLPFEETIMCNIGNPQAVGQQALTYPRQVMSLCLNPSQLAPGNRALTEQMYPQDVIRRAEYNLSRSGGGFGAYSHSQGLPFIREHIAEYITERDGGVPSDPGNIFMSNGASESISHVMQLLIRGEEHNDGILIPIPQYPLYSATLALLGGTMIPYELDEEQNWGFDLGILEASLKKAKENGVAPRAIVVINPGNPTGQVLSESNMRDVIDFCHQNQLILLADEVYQANIYDTQRPFHSFKKILADMGEVYQNTELVSFHSTSKGFLGECGFRGGYMECTNVDPEVLYELYKKVSISLCSNIPGQLMTDLMIKPPKEGEESYESYMAERKAILVSLSKRAENLSAKLNTMTGVSCNPAEGAMYLFPQVEFPQSVLKAAAKENLPADTFYCRHLLHATGICVVPGSGFGQKEGTYHYRTTFLPSETQIDQMISRLGAFHEDFMQGNFHSYPTML